MRRQIDHWLTDPDAFGGDFPPIYRFIGPDGVLATLQKWNFRFNTYEGMNDPRERKEWRASEIAPGLRPVGAFSQDQLDTHFDTLLRKGARVSCFTDDREPATSDARRWLLHRGWARSAMWDRYARQHKGACLVVQSDDLMQSMDTSTPLGVGSIRTWGRVEYTDLPIEIDLSADIASNDELEGVLDNYTSGRYVASQLYMTKLQDWQSEREFRAINILWNMPPSYDLAEPLMVPLGQALKAVILGEDFPDHAIAEVVDCIPPIGVAKPEVLRCTWTGGVPFLEYV